jgi:hypothetical protein
MHLVFVPITDDDRLSAKDIIGGPAGCRKWQDDFFKNMSSEFPGLLRGKDAELTGRKNLSPQKYKAVADKGSIWKLYAALLKNRKINCFTKNNQPRTCFAV